MTETEYTHKLDELDRLLNDPEIELEPAKVWTLLDEISGQDIKTHPASPEPQIEDGHSRRAAIRNSRLPSGPVIGLSTIPITLHLSNPDHQDRTRSVTSA